MIPDKPSSRPSGVEYFHNITNTWHTVTIERPPEVEATGLANTGQVYVYNTSMLGYFGETIDSRHTKLLHVRAGEKIYYHGSNDVSVKSILENGIDVTRSTRPTDFSCGDGFYVTKNYYRALDWSRRVVGWRRGRPAVIAFKINKSLRKEEPHLKLNENNTTNHKWWQCVVSHFRHAQRSEDVRNTLKDVKFIKGWVANNKYLLGEELPNPFTFTQLCIRDQEYASRFGCLANIAFVLFLVSP